MEMRDNKAFSVLLRVLPDELQPKREGELVRVELDGDAHSFLPIWIGEGLPADARRGKNEISHRVSAAPLSSIPVIVAHRLSPGARELLGADGISWADASGRARIVVPGHLYLARLDPIRVDARRGFKWSPAAEAIAEVLLTNFAGEHPPFAPIGRVNEIAALAGVSPAHAARVLRQFDEQRYTTKAGAERGVTATRELRDPGRMLSDWAGQYAVAGGPGSGVEFHVPWREPKSSISLLDEVLDDVEWAAASEAAAHELAPYLTHVPIVEAYVSGQLLTEARARLKRHPDVTEVQIGGRIRLYPADPYVLQLAEETPGARVVSPVRVYADLLRHAGRSAEAAEHLRETIIGF